MADHVSVRMYDVGFGDSFLIQFPVDGLRPFRVLVDCGAHSSGYPRAGWQPEDVVRQIIDDVDDGDGLHIDIVIATHRHQDHVSGFRAPVWSNVTVGEVWMPWTEHPTDPDAVALRRRQLRLADGLHQALNLKLAAAPGDKRLTSLLDMVTNALANEAAMRTLHSGFKGRPRHQFLSSGKPATISPEGCPGLTVHVMGPSRDERVIRDMDPPAGQSYLRFTDGDHAPDAAGVQRPFTRQFAFTEDTFAAHWPGLVLQPTIKEAASAMTRDDDVAAAVALDKAINGTSLMLMFEFGDAFLLFPGDAQWGTWRAALDNPTDRALLERTTFYKVGHHGSHNATPRELLEEVLSGRQMWGAAASVHHVGQWPQIPKPELMHQLEQSAQRVRRSDEPGVSADGVTVVPDIGIDFDIPF